MITLESDEDRTQWRHLTNQSGASGASLTRYAAAMHFYQRTMLSAESLEMFRERAKRDAENPLAGIAEVQFCLLAIRKLLACIDKYLARFDTMDIATVRQGIAACVGTAVEIPPASHLPACNHIHAALCAMQEKELARAIGIAAPFLQWVDYGAYPEEEIGATFAAGHAFASLIGEAAPIFASDFDVGLFVIGPGILYRDHKHAAPELYAPLTGPHSWRFKPNTPFIPRAADVPVWNEPHAPHATLVGEVPFLCIYCWTKDVNKPAVVVPASDWHLYEKLSVM